MRVIHFSITPLAGMPIRLVQALRRHTGIDARLADLQRFGLYDHDLVHAESPDDVRELAWSADVIHLHNYLDLDSQQFTGVDFRALARAGKAVVRQFHSSPELIAGVMGIGVRELLEQPLPALAIAQYPERLFPRARVVPNFVPEHDPAYLPSGEPPQWDVFFSPTKTMSAWEDRWSTKAMPEASEAIARAAEHSGCRAKVVTGLPLAEALDLKRLSRIVVDDLVTGSYHLTGLEGAAQGKCVLSFLDERSLMLLRRFSGSEEHPFLNVRLEDAQRALEELLAGPSLVEDAGIRARAWVERHWREERMVLHYEEAYELLLENPELVARQPELALDDPALVMRYRTLPDMVYRARAAAWARRTNASG
ncbi:glycosyltransferase [Fundidesulfovibrio soli]|uniref:glycosyltransferase n=1 Tax=Fundidesulfovibrio soli TaxID=2922716 RepID=UPI001FB03D94|nr:glycosyltransferase family 1 protein [Fundidesulfovibrio soli]